MKRVPTVTEALADITPPAVDFTTLTDDRLAELVAAMDEKRRTMSGASFGPYLEATRRWMTSR